MKLLIQISVDEQEKISRAKLFLDHNVVNWTEQYLLSEMAKHVLNSQGTGINIVLATERMCKKNIE